MKSFWYILMFVNISSSMKLFALHEHVLAFTFSFLSLESYPLLCVREREYSGPMATMNELLKEQETLKEEIKILKGQMNWVLETLQSLMKSEGVSHPITPREVVSPSLPVTLPAQGPLKFQRSGRSQPAFGPTPKPHQVVTKRISQHPLAASPQGFQSQSMNKKDPVKKNKACYRSVPVPLSKLYPLLIQNSLVTPRAFNPVPGPWHNANMTCEFHKRAEGHELDNCLALGHVVQELIIDKDLILEEDHPEVECKYHTGTVGHLVEECKASGLKVQSLLELLELQEDKPSTSGSALEASGKGPTKPLIILYHKEQVVVEGVSLHQA